MVDNLIKRGLCLVNGVVCIGVVEKRLIGFCSIARLHMLCEVKCLRCLKFNG